MGATLLSRAVGCAQSLISFIERNNSNDAGKFGKKFASALGVDTAWLVDGDESKAPPGFNAKDAEEGRKNSDKTVILMSARREGTPPAPRAPRLPVPVDPSPEDVLAPSMDAIRLSQVINESVISFYRLAGPELTKGLIKALDHLVSSLEGAHGHDKVRPGNERHDGA